MTEHPIQSIQLNRASFSLTACLAILGSWLTDQFSLALGVTLYVLSVMGALYAAGKFQKRETPVIMHWFAGLAIVFCLFLSFRDAVALRALNLLCLVIVASSVLIYQTESKHRSAPWIHWLTAPFRVVGSGLASPLYSLLRLHQDPIMNSHQNGLKSTLTGILIAIPIIGFFGILLAKADNRFAHWIEQLLVWDSHTFHEYFWQLLLFWIISSGIFHLCFYSSTKTTRTPPKYSLAHFNAIQSFVVVSSVALLFICYLCVQSTYFFGSDRLVQTTQGLTYSLYARSGFWELIWVAIFSMILCASVLWGNRHRTDRWHTRISRIIQLVIGLNLILLASAAHRMALYIEAYGLTQLRFYSSAFLMFIGISWGLFAIRVIQNKNHLLIWDNIRLFFIGVVILNLANPNGWIVNHNLTKQGLPPVSDTAFYNLGIDAAPTLIQFAIDNPEEACRVKQYLDRMQQGTPNWRNWNVAQWQSNKRIRQWDSPNCATSN